MEPIIKLAERDFQVKVEGGVFKACREVGIVVDKERLVQALEDAVKFYNEGYRDALNDNIVLCFDCKHYNRETLCCSFWPDNGFRDREHFCAEGVKREVEV